MGPVGKKIPDKIVAYFVKFPYSPVKFETAKFLDALITLNFKFNLVLK